jgi:2-deoxy-D-gluconate 3-dehydrogenase
MTTDIFRLDGKVALVTGSAQGLGQAMALALAGAGADITLLDRNESFETLRKVEELDRRVFPLRVDLSVTSLDGLGQVIERIISQFGRLDILVNNAGIIRRSPALEFSEQDWDDVISVNQKIVFFLCQAAGRQMRLQGGGKIINIASMLSFQGGILVPSYTASKSAVAGLTRALANEWAQYNINVNAIAPGYMATENTRPLREDAKRSESILERIPAGRWGTPADLAGVVVFLASEASSYLHGVIIPVDGGWLAR